MAKYKVDDEVIVYWGKKEKECEAKIVRINDDNTTVKLLWPEKSKSGNLIISSKFLISKIKEVKKEEDDAEGVGFDLFADDDNDNY